MDPDALIEMGISQTTPQYSLCLLGDYLAPPLVGWALEGTNCRCDSQPKGEPHQTRILVAPRTPDCALQVSIVYVRLLYLYSACCYCRAAAPPKRDENNSDGSIGAGAYSCKEGDSKVANEGIGREVGDKLIASCGKGKTSSIFSTFYTKQYFEGTN